MRTLILAFLFASLPSIANNSWDDVLASGKGTITIFYYPDNSQIENSRDIIDRFEEDLILSFASYLESKYPIKLEVKWDNVGDFNKIFDRIEAGGNGQFGLSTISITRERAERVRFTSPYLADVQVIVTNDAFKLANTAEQLGDFVDGKTAISIRNTTLEKGLNRIKNDLNVDFNLKYVSNTGELVQAIAEDSNSFGYVDLINFLVSFENLAQLKRQLFYPIKLEGIGMIYPIDSDWHQVIEEYFSSDQFSQDKIRITNKYFGAEIGGVINQLTDATDFGLYEEIIISNREKEIQYQELFLTLERERQQHLYNDMLLIILGIVVLAGAVLLVSYRIKSQVNRVLVEQQETIETRNNELKILNDEKNEIIKVLAHDLRSPLSNIQGCALMLGEEKELEASSRKMIDIIGDASNRIKSMISKILDVDAIESGNRNIQLEVISPTLVIEELIYQNLDTAKKKNISVFLKEGSDLKVKADRFYLAQVLENLLLNAVKFSEPESEVLFEVKKYENMVRIVVKDFGPGISNQDKRKVFEKFAHLSAKPTGGEESIGLGLSIVKKYTEMMQGKVSFQSELGNGTEFYVDLDEA